MCIGQKCPGSFVLHARCLARMLRTHVALENAQRLRVAVGPAVAVRNHGALRPQKRDGEEGGRVPMNRLSLRSEP